MKRHLYQELVAWKNSSDRKPLMLYGARQVGKTYLLKEFGKQEYENMVYVNCYKNEAVATLFAETKNVKMLLMGLSAISGQPINPETTFLFLDEVQEVPDVVGALKYFYEDAPEISIAVAGSLLGVLNLKSTSFPTGKVCIKHLYPMTFIEFLQAMGKDAMVQLLNDNGSQPVVNSLLVQFTEFLRQYYFVGGMPEVVLNHVNGKSPAEIRNLQLDILSAYEADIAKHAGADALRARMVFQSIPMQLARENRRFVFSALRKGARAADFEKAIQWLVDAGLVYKVNCLSKVVSPIKFYMEPNVFKLYMLDVGLLGAMVMADPAQILVGDLAFKEYKGAFTENYVLTQMITVPETVIGYFSKQNSSLEIDFVVQLGAKILPVEVKAELNVKAKSLRQFVTVEMAGSGIKGYRLSMQGFESQSWVENIPLCAVIPWLNNLK